MSGNRDVSLSGANCYHHFMVQILSATFKDGVFKPDERPALSDASRVRLVVEALDADDARRRAESWEILKQIWSTTTFNSGGDRLTRDQLHDRH